MKRILYIHHTFRDQSYNSLLFELAKRVHKKKYEILVCCLREGGPYETKFGSIGVQIKNFGMKSLLKFWTVYKIVKFIKENEIDIVSTAMFPADVYGRISAKLAGVPVILSTMHRFEDYKQEKKYKYLFWLDTITMSFATKIVAVSETVKNYLIDWHKLDPGKVVTLYNGIDVDSFRDKGKQSHILNKFGLRTDFFTVGVVGRLVSVKGFDYFLDAAAIVLKTPKKVQFLIVGDGPLRGALEKRARDLGIHEDVVFTGFREEIPEILGVLDIFVTSSLSEGLPTAVLEAMCAGKPVVGTNVGAIPETVTNGDTGVIVPARDAESLANAILDLLDSPETRHKMGERGRQRVIDHFSIERMVENYERFYDSVSK